MQTEKSDPFQFMIKNRKTIIEILEQSSTLKNAWNILHGRLPTIKDVTKFNTFKGYARILNVVDGKLAELEKENKRLSEELGKVRQSREELSDRLDKVRQKLDGRTGSKAENSEMDSPTCGEDKGSLVKKVPDFLPNPEKGTIPKRVDGWGVQFRGKYYRIFKKIKGKVKWIHIGKKWNTETAREKIRRFRG